MPPPEDFLDEGENGECCFCGQNGRSRYKLRVSPEACFHSHHQEWDTIGI